MKILLVAPIHQEIDFIDQKKEELKKNGKSINPFPVFQGQNSWYKALVNLGHEIKVFYYTDSVIIPNFLRIKLQNILIENFPLWYSRLLRLRSRFYFFAIDNYFRNLKLARESFSFKPDLIIISGGTSVLFPMTIKNIKKRLHCKVALLNGMDPLTRSTITERKMVKIVDVFFTNDSGHAESWLKLGAKKSICLPVSSVDSDFYQKIELVREEKQALTCDVCFVGNLSLERQKILSGLTKFNLKIWGDFDPKTKLLPELKKCFQGKAYGREMVKIFNCAKIVLNLHDHSMKNGGNLRTFEICGCGAFQLADRVPKEWFVSGEELVTFLGISDLKQKIHFFLNNDKKRKEIAELGFKRVLKDHTYEKHFAKLLTYI